MNRLLKPRMLLNPPLRFLVLVSALLISILAAYAEAPPSPIGISDGLPETPIAQESAPATAKASSSARIAGSVVDQSGAAIVNARVTLVDGSGRSVTNMQTGGNGEFVFDGLSGGSFQLLVKAVGFASATTSTFTISSAQAYAAPNIELLVANASSEVSVTASEAEIATAQVKAEEKQRVLGFVPNFYTSFVYDAVRLNKKQKYSLALRDTFDPARFVGTGIGAGFQQAFNNFKGYGQGAAGYGKRYAALYGDGLTSDILSHAVFPALLHQDPRYFYQGTGSTKSRLVHAISFAVVARSDSGRTIPNYSYLLGDLGSGALSNLYYPHADRGVGLVFSNAAIGVAGRAAGTIVQEFVLPRFTTHVPGKGRP